MSPADVRPRRWRVRRLGAPADALALEEAPVLAPGPGQVRVDVGAVGLNHPDLLLCAGRYQERPDLPFTPGYEAAGTVAEVGPGSTHRVGERVLVVPELPDGAMQETLTVDDGQAYPVPEELPVEVAAVLHIAWSTAHVALHHRARLRPGETLVVTGAAGGVGSAAVQLGRAAGATVVAVASGEDKLRACRDLGADAVVDATGSDLTGRLREALGPRGADVVLDVVGGEQFEVLRHLIAFEGRIVTAGFTSGAIPAAPVNHVLLRNYSVVGLHLAPYRRHDPTLLRDVHEQLVELALSGVVAPRITELPFDEAVEGLGLLAARRAIGRVVLRCGR